MPLFHIRKSESRDFRLQCSNGQTCLGSSPAGSLKEVFTLPHLFHMDSMDSMDFSHFHGLLWTFCGLAMDFFFLVRPTAKCEI